MVNLERNPAYTESNIPIENDNYYRGLVAKDYDSLWDEDGKMKGYGKGGTDRLSFQKGHPNDLYVNGLVQANMILQTDEHTPVDHITREGYAYVDSIDREAVESGELHMRVWVRKAGKEAINQVHIWEKIFSSYPEDH